MNAGAGERQGVRPPSTAATEPELERYARQLELEHWGLATQERLAHASAIVVGAGALGSPAATYVTAAGIGRVGVVDHADVKLGDLASQPLHYTPDIGANKAESAAAKLGVLNSQVQAEPYPVRIEEMNARPIVSGADVVLDCSGSHETGVLVGDASWAEGIPLVAGWASGSSGFVTSVWPGRSACGRCARAAAKGEGERGTLGPIAGVVGALQALEALKLVTRIGASLLGRVLRLDGLTLAQTSVPAPPRAGCPVCAELPAEQQSS